MVTIYDVAKAAGVSPATVSRVFSGRGSEANRKKVQQVAEELNYTPNSAAQTMRTGMTNHILMLIPEIRNPFYFKMIEGVNEVLEEYNYQFILNYTKHSLEAEIKAISMARQRIVDGMIVVSFNFCGKNINAIRESRVPAILTNQYNNLKLEDKIDYVYVDTQSGIRIATEHLIKKGHKNIAYVGGSVKEQTGLERFKGYKQAIINAGLNIDKKNVYNANYIEETAYHIGLHFLKDKNRPTAVVAANDLMALGLMSAAKKLGLKIPDDLAITGMDNTELSERTSPTLTTIDMKEYDIGVRAARQLMALLQDKTAEFKRQKIAPTLIIRESS